MINVNISKVHSEIEIGFRPVRNSFLPLLREASNHKASDVWDYFPNKQALTQGRHYISNLVCLYLRYFLSSLLTFQQPFVRLLIVLGVG